MLSPSISPEAKDQSDFEKPLWQRMKANDLPTPPRVHLEFYMIVIGPNSAPLLATGYQKTLLIQTQAFSLLPHSLVLKTTEGLFHYTIYSIHSITYLSVYM